ncbi:MULTISPECIES: DUF305 domain-containing protein [unclassified Mycobacterium]|uniref:DUF305 domain-containing protein n=1 Tax=unclassified Mycobacterium TaxID=2642494 RepID=UPI0029C7334B|nr:MULTISPECIES: DUF305 domain-containing protein [unclassified Mycobacterium]
MKSLLAVLAALATVLFLSACSSAAPDQHGTNSASADTSTVVTKPADFNDADVAFATDMIPHHQQAVEMSAMVPSRSTNPELVKLAADISAAQGPEIETMKVFLVQWTGGEAPAGHDGHDTGGMQMPGMTDDGTMTKLESLKGAEFDTLWLQSMIGHHEGAIAMAKTELADGTNVDAKGLAQGIVTGQEAEITQMKQMLGG